MTYSVDLIKKNKQKTTTWSGGTTTELAIYPRDAIYSEVNFKWRLSSAKVEIEESRFTFLPKIWRHIMIIEGELALKHEGHHSVNLKPFEQDSFSGEWITRSIGKVRDFNLMLDDGCQGELTSIHLKNRMSSKITNENSSWISNYTDLTQAFYCIIGSTNIVINNTKKISLYEGDLLLINIDNKEISINIEINNIAEQCANIIMSSILY